MEAVFQMIDAVLAEYIYGTAADPRPPIARLVLRTIVLGGAGFVVAVILGFVSASFWIVVLCLIWFFAAVVVMGAEFRLGHPPLYFVILAILLLQATLAGFMAIWG